MRPGAEWLETDGLGGFASGPVEGPPTRRYHAVLIAARMPPSRRVVLVNGFDAWVETATGRWPLTCHRYVPDVTAPGRPADVIAFSSEPWPTWSYRTGDGLELVHELIVLRGAPVTALCWRLQARRTDAVLAVRPFLTGRDLHALHSENQALQFAADIRPGRIRWRPYDSVPAVVALSNGTYAHDPEWYRHVQYDADRARGYDFEEDLASPGVMRWDLSAGEAVCVLGADLPEATARLSGTATAESVL